MLENLSQRINKALHLLKGYGQITEINVAETTKEIRRSLLDADVNFKLAKEFTNKVKEKAIGQNVLQTLNPGQLFTKIVRDELAELMGAEASEMNLGKNPSVILMSGLQGSGKTTISAKLSNYLKKKKGKNPLLVAADVYRPAAITQLHMLGRQVGIDVYSEKDNKNPLDIAKNSIKQARSHNHNVIIIDTAGRLSIDQEMMDEISAIHTALEPEETLFVVDSMTGQDAITTAKNFNEVLNFDGVVLTKLDGDTRGGAALSIKNVINKPIKFIGTGEKIDDIDIFHPDRMADRILGMGDVISLVEKAQEQFDVEESKRLKRKISKDQFGLDDYLSQIKKLKKIGKMKDIIGMIPGANNIKDIEIDDGIFKTTEAIIQSMTPTERSQPKIIDSRRKKRIANGSGTNVEEVNKLMKQFQQMGKMMKMMKGPGGKSKMIDMLGKIS
ncbi:signal recognition particle protein [Elysia marginata]|uniref:Signal recognition particle subunit SRP54 n=1 Tax=Elysia marginata TaxID=1093978 RepID=A0AAV4FXM1_9GAST|nr:signal recognition particle protein [Elysia marginata]